MIFGTPVVEPADHLVKVHGAKAPQIIRDLARELRATSPETANILTSACRVIEAKSAPQTEGPLQ
jgi:hypothetical protein